MQAKIITIGNSQGVRLPKHLLEQSCITPGAAVEITVIDSGLLITPARKPREGWEVAATEAAKQQHEDLWEGMPVGEAWDE